MTCPRIARGLQVAALLTCVPTAWAATLTRGPYLQLLTSRSVTIVWNTDEPADCSLDLRPIGGGHTILPGGAGEVCAVPVANLSPGRLYGYTPRADGVPLRSESVFQTDASGLPFTFAVLGDSGSGDSHQRAVRDRILEANPDLAVHTGDMVYASGEPENFNPRFFTPYRDLIRRLVFWPCLGNHDILTDEAQPWRDSFFTPANNPTESEEYYSFNYGNAHFVVLDSNDGLRAGSEQVNFLDSDLRNSNARWKFVFFHHTIYSSSGSIDRRMRDSLIPIFDDRHVDLVFMGHHHNYERTKPLRAGNVVSAGKGTVYVTTGGGGESLSPVVGASYTADTEAVFHFVRVSVDGDELELDMIRDDGEVRDSLSVSKTTTTTTTTSTTTTSTTTTSTSTTAPSSSSTSSTTTSTTSTTLHGSSTTSTTLPITCHSLSCDDADPCTIDSCLPTQGCAHTSLELNLVTRPIHRRLGVQSCGHQPVPLIVARRVRRAERMLSHALALSSPAGAAQLATNARLELARGAAAVRTATVRGHLSVGCETDLLTTIASRWTQRADCVVFRGSQTSP